MTSASRPNWELAPPSVYDIATCYFPEATATETSPKLRPCLVTQVLRGVEKDYAARVAFGTTVLKIAERGRLDLIIQDAAVLARLGLRDATRFDLDRLLILPWTSEFFGCWSRFRTPFISTLTADCIKEYAFLMMTRQSS